MSQLSIPDPWATALMPVTVWATAPGRGPRPSPRGTISGPHNPVCTRLPKRENQVVLVWLHLFPFISDWIRLSNQFLTDVLLSVWSLYSLLFLFIEMCLIYSVVSVSAVQQGDLVVCVECYSRLSWAQCLQFQFPSLLQNSQNITFWNVNWTWRLQI